MIEHRAKVGRFGKAYAESLLLILEREVAP
jgi:hypothetical protein